MTNQPPLNPAAERVAIARLLKSEIGQSMNFKGTDVVEVVQVVVSAYLAAQPEVKSVEELEALPPESYVQGWDGFKHAKTHSGEWVLCVEHTRGAHKSESIELPARVLYRPNEGGHDGR